MESVRRADEARVVMVHRRYRKSDGRNIRHLAVALMAFFATGLAVADDFERLVANAGPERTVSVMVTGWYAVTGEMTTQGSRGDGTVAVTGDEFVEHLRSASTQVSVTRRYENLPVLAMEMDGAALRRAKMRGSGVEIWEDPVLEPLLQQSTRIVGADDAWRRGYTGAGVAVAVIDDGADVDHEFLQGRVIFEGCFADQCPNGQPAMIGPGAAYPVGPHGTHVSGIVLGQSRSTDLSGVGPDLRLIIINVANRNSRGMSGNGILAALDVVITLARYNPGVIGAVNMSLGASRDSFGICQSSIWDLASRLLRETGVAVAVASGNDSRSQRAAPVGFPACIEGFVSVGAVTKTGRVADFSNSGPSLELLAPGVEILSSVAKPSGGRITRGFESWPGTSMAAPHVAGALALIYQAAPERTVAERVAALKDTGQRIRDPRNGVTVPLIDLGEAIEYLQPGRNAANAASPVELKLPPSFDPSPEEQPKESWTPVGG